MLYTNPLNHIISVNLSNNQNPHVTDKQIMIPEVKSVANITKIITEKVEQNHQLSESTKLSY